MDDPETNGVSSYHYEAGSRVPQTPKRGPRVVTAIALILSAMWAWSGVSKLIDPGGFQTIVESHGVLPLTAIHFAVLIGPVELSLACCIGIMGGRPTRAGFLVSLVSALLVGAFSFYLLLVPEATLEATGCGCRTGLDNVTSGLESSARTTALGLNAAMGLMHVPLLIPKSFTRF